MIKKVYSKSNPSLLLNLIYVSEPSQGKTEKIERSGITEPGHFLQAMSFKLPADTEVKPHKHNPQERETSQTHEACLVLEGAIELSVYDTDNSIVEKTVLNGGDCTILINGGHSIKTLTESKLFEFKNGPYNGPEKDKTPIN